MLVYQWGGLYYKFRFVADPQDLCRLKRCIKVAEFLKAELWKQENDVAVVFYCRWQSKRNDF